MHFFNRWLSFFIFTTTLLLPGLSAQTSVVDLSFSINRSKYRFDSRDPWEQMINQFDINFPHQAGQVDRQVEALLQDQYHINRALANMAPYLPWLLNEVEKKQLPAEILVIPLIESCYELNVSSKYGALGLWQIMPITAAHMKLQPTYGFEPRLDIEHSTDAAMTFIEQLYKSFDSWVLTLAAYNAGPSRVKSALKKVKYRHDMDFFKLDLPEQTLKYVPKILAFAHILKHHDYYKLKFPKHVDHLSHVVLEKEQDFSTLALALDCPVSLIRKYNHQYLFKVVPRDSSRNLFIPNSFIRSGQRHLHHKLDHYRSNPYYKVKRGDSLLKIAARFSTSVQSIMDANGMKETFLKEGQLIKIDPIGTSLVKPVDYIVKKGDCLTKIAQSYDITVKDIQKTNHLTSSKIFIGQKLVLVKH